MAASLDLSEVRALADDLRAGADITAEVRAEVVRTGDAVLGTMMVLTPVDTGALVNSETLDVDGLGFEAGPSVEYGVYVELGTSEMAPQPYAGPAFDQHVDPFVDRLGDIGVRVVA